jgi:hypothetical protein
MGVSSEVDEAGLKPVAGERRNPALTPTSLRRSWRQLFLRAVLRPAALGRQRDRPSPGRGQAICTRAAGGAACTTAAALGDASQLRDPTAKVIESTNELLLLGSQGANRGLNRPLP